MVSKFFAFFSLVSFLFVSDAGAREVRTAGEAFRLGETAFLNEQYDKSEAYYRRAMEIEPQLAAPVIRLGELYYAQNRYRDAGDMFELADLLKKDRFTKKFLAIAMQKMKDQSSLLERIENATKENNRGLLAELHAEAARRMGEPPTWMALVAPHLEYLSKADGKNPEVLRTLADGYFSSSDPVKAFVQYKKLLKQVPVDGVLLERYADTAVNVGAYDEARLSYKKAMRLAMRSGQVDKIRTLKKTIHSLPAFSDRIDAFVRSEDYLEAFRELRKYLVRNPTHPWAVVQMGRIYEELGHPAQAERLYQKAIQWRPEDPGAHYAMGRYHLYKKKQFEKALEEFQLFRTLLSENVGLTMDESMKKKLAEHLRDATRSIAYVNLEVLGHPKIAAAELEKITRSGTAEAKDYYDLGVAYWRMQKRSAAYQALQKVIQMDPKSEIAKDANQLIESIRLMSRQGFEVQAGSQE